MREFAERDGLQIGTMTAWADMHDARVTLAELSNFLDGKGRMSGKLAEFFSPMFNTSVQFWLDQQANYDTHRAQQRDSVPAQLARIADALERIAAAWESPKGGV